MQNKQKTITKYMFFVFINMNLKTNYQVKKNIIASNWLNFEQ